MLRNLKTSQKRHFFFRRSVVNYMHKLHTAKVSRNKFYFKGDYTMKKTEEKNKVIKVIEKARSTALPYCGQSTHIGGCTIGVVAKQ